MKNAKIERRQNIERKKKKAKSLKQRKLSIWNSFGPNQYHSANCNGQNKCPFFMMLQF